MQDNNKLLKRTESPQTLASSLGTVLKILKISVSGSDLVNNWNKVIGDELSNMIKLNTITKTTDKKINIYIKLLNPAFSLEISYKLDTIKEKINKFYGINIVNKVSIKK